MHLALDRVGVILVICIVQSTASTVKLNGGGVALVRDAFKSLLSLYSQARRGIDNQVRVLLIEHSSPQVLGGYMAERVEKIISEMDSQTLATTLFAAFEGANASHLPSMENIITVPAFYV